MIRVATMDDLDSCLHLFAIGERENPKAYADCNQDMVCAHVSDGTMIVAEDNGKVVGMIAGYRLNGRTLLDMIVTLPSHRNHSLAPELVKGAIKHFGKSVSVIVPHVKKSFEMAGMKPTGFVMESYDS